MPGILEKTEEGVTVPVAVGAGDGVPVDVGTAVAEFVGVGVNVGVTDGAGTVGFFFCSSSCSGQGTGAPVGSRQVWA
jgi:hypothetical protein